MRFNLIIFTGIVCMSSGSKALCPFSAALRQGQLSQRYANQQKAQLMANDVFVNPGDPGWIIQQVFEIDPSDAAVYNRTAVLLDAQQFYVDEYQRQRATNVSLPFLSTAQLLRAIQPTVALSDRCKPPTKCDPKAKYVRNDGRCNNLRVPHLGSAQSPFGRLVAAHYDDAIRTVRRSRRSRSALPSPRLIGNILLQHSVYDPLPQRVPNHGSLHFGQYIVHDTSYRESHQKMNFVRSANGLRCCTKDRRRPLADPMSYGSICMPVDVPADDPFYSRVGGGCLEYVRSMAVFGNNCALGAAQISSAVTQHLDQSSLYGSTLAALRKLRIFSGGRIRIANNVLPCAEPCRGQFRYFVGDNRGAFFVALGLWESVLARLHNVLADGLAAVNGHWPDERLFQEARRISTAVYQSVVYNEWLPLYLGERRARRRSLSCAPESAYCGRYDARVDGATTNDWSAGVFRMFHANVPEVINFYGGGYALNASIAMSGLAQGAGLLETEYLGMMRGFFKDPIAMGAEFSPTMRNTIFNNEQPDGIGIDMFTIDIMRGRDHGIAPYYIYLELCWSKTGRKVTGWTDLTGIVSAQSLQLLRSVYETVHDVDLLVGVLLETKRGRLVGPAAAYVIEEQFYRHKYGNRYFYSFPDGPHPLSAAQIRSVNGMRWADVLCRCSAIGRVPQRVFETLGAQNRLVPCQNRMVDLRLWAENATTKN